MRKKRPGAAAHVLAALFTLILVAATAAAGVTWQAHRLLSNPSLHEQVALDPRVIDAQIDRVEQTVNALAAKYSFAPESVMALINQESLADYGREVVAWWTSLLTPAPDLFAPEWDPSAVEEAVREDALFQESTPANQRRTIARDNVAYEVGQAVDRAVLPVRVKLVTPFLPLVLRKVDVPRYIGYLALLPWVLAAAAALVCLLILAVMYRRPSTAMLYVGSGLAGGALTLALVWLAALALNVPGQVAEIAPVLSLQIRLLAGKVANQGGLYAFICFAVGVTLIALYQRTPVSLPRRQRSVNA